MSAARGIATIAGLAVIAAIGYVVYQKIGNQYGTSQCSNFIYSTFYPQICKPGGGGVPCTANICQGGYIYQCNPDGTLMATTTPCGGGEPPDGSGCVEDFCGNEGYIYHCNADGTLTKTTTPCGGGGGGGGGGTSSCYSVAAMYKWSVDGTYYGSEIDMNVPFTVSFEYAGFASSAVQPGVTFTWDFDDGTPPRTGTGAEMLDVEHTYSLPGANNGAHPYVPKLTTYNPCNGQTSVTTGRMIYARPPTYIPPVIG